MAKKLPTLRVQGLTKALVKLDVIGNDERREEVQGILVAAANMIKEQAQANINARSSAGNWKPHVFKLSDGRAFRIAPGDIRKAVEAGPSPKGYGAFARIDFLKAPHAWVLEFGDKSGKIQPQAFWRNAIRKSRKQVVAFIKKELSDMLVQYVGADEPENVFKRRKKKTP